MARFVFCLLAAIMLIGASPAWAADTVTTGSVKCAPQAPAVAGAPPPPPGVTGSVPCAQGPVTGPLQPPPGIRYGCRRVWRCDQTVCEWRRGCWGVYGYVEGPYFTSEFARRQWEQHGLPALLQRPAPVRRYQTPAGN